MSSLTFMNLENLKRYFMILTFTADVLLISKIRQFRGVSQFFILEKMISVGTKSEQEAFRELNSATKFLIEKGFVKPIVLQPKVRNIVITSSLEPNLNLEKLAETPKAIYEPEQFLGVILRLEQPYKATILIFASGKIVVAGLTSSTQIEPVAQKVQKFVKEKQ